MRALQGLVIGMGVLIVIGLALVAYGLVGRVGDDDERAGGFGDVMLAAPAGCVIAAASAEGNRLILRLNGPVERGCQQVVVLGLDTGQVLGRITAEPRP